MSLPGWFPNELAHAGPEHLDPAYVPGYDRKAKTDPADDIALLRDLGLSERHTLVDIGAGTGTFALAVAPYCGWVIAVDVSPVMLAGLEEKARHLGIANIACVQGGFLSYEHAGDAADVVYSRNALHHLPDFWKVIALRRIAAILKPGGLFRLHDLVYAFDPDATEHVLEAWFAGAVSDQAEGWTRAGGAGDPCQGGTQHVRLAAGTDARPPGLRHPGRGPQPGRHVCGLHLRQDRLIDPFLDRRSVRAWPDK